MMLVVKPLTTTFRVFLVGENVKNFVFVVLKYFYTLFSIGTLDFHGVSLKAFTMIVFTGEVAISFVAAFLYSLLGTMFGGRSLACREK